MDWRIQHKQTIEDFIIWLNQNSRGFVLKGGTALMLCYNLDRFSEDVDLDGTAESGDIIALVNVWATQRNYKYNINKNTPTVKRIMIHYGGEKPLKIETSYRRKSIFSQELAVINSILTYEIETMLDMKCSAYQARDHIRDMYDVCFIVNNYGATLSQGALSRTAMAISYKGFSQYDYLVRSDDDKLIDKNKLAGMFIQTWKFLGLNI